MGGGGVGSSPPPGDAAQGDQRKTTVNCNNYSSGRALDDENILGGRGLVSMIQDESDRAGVATGGDNEGNHLCSHNKGIGRGAGIRCSIHSECIVT